MRDEKDGTDVLKNAGLSTNYIISAGNLDDRVMQNTHWDFMRKKNLKTMKRKPCTITSVQEVLNQILIQT